MPTLARLRAGTSPAPTPSIHPSPVGAALVAARVSRRGRYPHRPAPGGDKPRAYDPPIHPSPVGAALVAARVPRRGRCSSARSGRGQAPPLRSLYTPLSRRGGPRGRPCPTQAPMPTSARRPAGTSPAPTIPLYAPSPVGAALLSFQSACMALFSILFVFHPSYITIWS